MKTIPAVKAVREGVDVRIGVWSDSDSVATVEAVDVTDLVGIVIFGLGLSIFAGSSIAGPGLLECSGSILMPPKEEIDGLGSESESESSILQMGRCASKTSSSLSFSLCNSSISLCKRDFSSSSWSVSFCSVSVSSLRRLRHFAAASLFRSLLILRLSISSWDKCSSFLRLVGAVVLAAALMTPGLRKWEWEGGATSGRAPERVG